jgi:hypothetical protein
MKRPLSKWLLVVAGCLLPAALLGHDQTVHRKITEAAADSANAPGKNYASFLQTVSSEIIPQDARDNLSDGSDFEAFEVLNYLIP